MIGKLFKRRAAPAARSIPQTPADTAIWAFGDIHGRLDLLEPLIDAVDADIREDSSARKVVVFLGDYVDRGPNSRGVIDYLCAYRERSGAEVHFLRGNHEEKMEAFLTDPSVGPAWCDYGGRETLRSYGLTAPVQRDDHEGWARTSADFNTAVSQTQKRFLAEQEWSFEAGDFFFVHAGARPGVPLDAQNNYDLLWIRQSFLDDPRPFERMIVHGHTPTSDVHLDNRRIGLDTGAYASGVLTAAKFKGPHRIAFQTSLTGTDIAVYRKGL